MSQRIKIISNLIDLVPIIHIFNSDLHKSVFNELLRGWKTEKELKEIIGTDVNKSIELLKMGHLIAGRWRTPERGEMPEMEYAAAYSKIKADFQSDFEDMGDVINIAVMDDDTFGEYESAIIKKINKDKRSINEICRELNYSPSFLRGLLKRSLLLDLRGQDVVILKNANTAKK
ncbi:MAG TPA: ArsR family transcriptional regulator [Halobacteria archaeon]|jgi:predicted DNA-binding ArsR family transcriptional regulator|nr:ArsR family transcriptional regulator [Halobacteria archaeon]